MPLLPPTTNAVYYGARFPLGVLGLVSVLTLIPACLHILLPDGGTNVIVGPDCDQHERRVDLAHAEGCRVISLMVWAGTIQLVWGVMLLLVVLRYRTLVPPALGLLMLERLLHGWHMWGPEGGAHHSPEAYATLAMIPLLAVAFVLSLRARTA